MENPFDAEKLQRPTFLTVLCILTFVSTGWGILSGVFSLFTKNLFDGNMQMEQFNSMSGENHSPFISQLMGSTMEMLQVSVVYGTQINLCNLVLTVITLIGAIQMYNLKRLGFYLYVAAQVLMLFIWPYFAGFSMILVMSMIVSALFTTIFIILYALNLKYMK